MRKEIRILRNTLVKGITYFCFWSWANTGGFLLCYFRLSRTPGAIGMMLNKAVGCFSKTKYQNTRKWNNCGKINPLFDDSEYHTRAHLAHCYYFPPHYSTRKNLTELGKYSRELKYRREYKFFIHSFRTDRSSKMFQVCPLFFQSVHSVNLQREKYSCLGTAVFFSLTQWRYHYKMCLKL